MAEWIICAKLISSLISTASNSFDTIKTVKQYYNSSIDAGDIIEDIDKIDEVNDTVIKETKTLNKSFYATASNEEKVLMITLADVCDSFKNMSRNVEIYVEINLGIVNRQGCYTRTIDVKNGCFCNRYNGTDCAETIYDLINEIRELMAMRVNDGYGSKNFIVTMSYRRNELSESEEVIVAAMTGIGVAISKILSRNYQGEIVRAGFSEVDKIQYLNDVNLVIEADWGRPVADAALMVMKVREMIQKTNNYEHIMNEINNMSKQDGSRNIILLGRSGTGKSRTGNLLARLLGGAEQQNLFMESDNGACTNRIASIVCGNDKNIRIWDTPGLQDQYNRDEMFKQKIRDAMFEIGQISSIILCEDSIHRISPHQENMIGGYAEIIGPAMQDRLTIVVNKSQSKVGLDQKESYAAKLEKKGISISNQTIYDLNASDDLKEERLKFTNEEEHAFVARQLSLCGKKAIRIGTIERLYKGILALQEMEKGKERIELEDELIKKSSATLRSEIMKGRNREPQIYANWHHKIVMIRRNDYSNTYGTRCTTRWSIKTHKKPEGIFEKVTANIKALCYGLTMTGGLKEALQYLEQKRLVFIKREEHISESKEVYGGIVITYRYTMLDIEKGLTEDTKMYLENIIENKNAETSQKPSRPNSAKRK